MIAHCPPDGKRNRPDRSHGPQGVTVENSDERSQAPTEAGAQPLVDAGPLRAGVHGSPRRLHRQRHRALAAGRPRRERLRPPVGGRRLPAHLRPLADYRRAARGRLRPPQDVQARHRRLHGRLGALRGGTRPDDADRRPVATGLRRRRDVAAGPVDHPGRVLAGREAQGPRLPGSRPGPGGHLRADRRRRSDRPRHPRPRLALGLPDQHPGRADRPARGRPADPGVALGDSPPAGPGRRCARHAHAQPGDDPGGRGPRARLAVLDLRRVRRGDPGRRALRRRRAADHGPRRLPSGRAPPVRDARLPDRPALRDDSLLRDLVLLPPRDLPAGGPRPEPARLGPRLHAHRGRLRQRLA